MFPAHGDVVLVVVSRMRSTMPFPPYYYVGKRNDDWLDCTHETISLDVLHAAVQRSIEVTNDLLQVFV